MTEAAAALAEQPQSVADSPLTGESLASTLRLFSLVVDRRVTIPVLECVRLVADGNSLTISGTDLDQQLVCCLPRKGIGFEVCVPLHSLMAAAEAFGTEKPIFASSPKQFRLSGRSGEFHLPTLPVGDFAEITRPQPKATVVISRHDLLKAIYACRAGASSEETRYYLNGICATQKADRIEFVATDGHRLHTMTVPAAIDGSLPQSILGTKGARCLQSLLELSAADDIAIEFGENRAAFGLGQWGLLIKCIDDCFPDYSRVIPNEIGGILTLPGAELTAALKAIDKLQVSRNIRSGRMEPAVRTVSYSDPEGLSFSCSLPGSTSGEVPKEFGFNVRYLMDILATHPGREVTIGFPYANGAAPMLLTFAEDADFLAVLMPMRV